MIRRQFLGTVLGYIASTGLPWTAERVSPRSREFQVAIQLPGGLLIKAPPLDRLILDFRREHKLRLSGIKYEDRGIKNLLTKSKLIFIGMDFETPDTAYGQGEEPGTTAITVFVPNHPWLLDQLQKITPIIITRTYDPHLIRRNE